nr:MAG TPA: hypothetical protein [Caudoviricetes sp.]
MSSHTATWIAIIININYSGFFRYRIRRVRPRDAIKIISSIFI